MVMLEDNLHLRVLVVADNPLSRVGLASLLGERAALEVVGQVDEADDLLGRADVFRPDVVVWDMGWETSLEAGPLEALLEAELPLLVMVNDTTQAADLWRAGVRGLLLQETDPERIEAAVLGLAHGLAVLDRTLDEVIDVPPGGLEGPVEALTAREMETLALLAEGLTNKAIAYQLGISDHTVKFHVTSIMAKLEARSRTEAVVTATRLGLIHL